jgi:hypothetical protein
MIAVEIRNDRRSFAKQPGIIFRAPAGHFGDEGASDRTDPGIVSIFDASELRTTHPLFLLNVAPDLSLRPSISMRSPLHFCLRRRSYASQPGIIFITARDHFMAMADDGRPAGMPASPGKFLQRTDVFR